jgi:dihydroorotate dehydrogenase
LSGAPLSEQARQLTQSLLLALNGRIPVLASGGMMNVESAESRIKMGVPLIQLYTGFVYSGPKLIYTIASIGKGNKKD